MSKESHYLKEIISILKTSSMDDSIYKSLLSQQKVFIESNFELREENKKLKEELAITRKQLEELQQPKEDVSTYTVKLDGSEVYDAVKKVADEFTKELEKKEQPNDIILYDKNNPDNKVVINNKGIRLYEGDILTSKTK
ncbi:hypothetical protein [Macrococcus armenti]|uniref:hypothetical protein n=1 Tax=Macrococcus armenti TaxID=2875764 RepID=UPI001CD74626|nr:hypothetical protein [Macrococcus armenti]UBH10084.1 hypothetical protein LAU38_07295 [Macrococcus armenti]